MIIGVSGIINSGKNTIATHLIENYGFKKDSFAATLKDVCSCVFGWSRELLEGDTLESRKWREEIDIWWANKLSIPEFSPRYALQHIGTDLFRNHFNSEIWHTSMENRICKNPEQNYVISDIRFSNEVNFVRNHGGILIRVYRGESPEWYEIASLAVAGDFASETIMKNTYSDVHYSEWACAGTEYDYVINNNSTIDIVKTQIDKIMKEISENTT